MLRLRVATYNIHKGVTGIARRVRVHLAVPEPADIDLCKTCKQNRKGRRRNDHCQATRS